jgi:hypothetical protein
MKTVVLTFTFTIIAIALSAKIFFTSILTGLGYTVTTIDSLNKLNHSQQIVEKVKKRHKSKKIKATKTFVKNSGKKIATSAIAASTVGTLAVIGAVTAFEMREFCDEKKELLEESNILHDTDIKFDYSVCLKDAKEDSKKFIDEVTDNVSLASSELIKNTKIYSDETWSDIKASIQSTYISTSNFSSDLWSAIQRISQ